MSLGKTLAAVIGLELLVGLPASLLMRQPMIGLIVTWGVVLATFPVVVALKVGGRGRGGYYSSDPLEPWMKSRMYFNNEAMRRDLDRMAQIAQEQSIREKMGDDR